MHEMGIFWLRVATAFYAVGLIHAIVVVLRRNARAFKAALGAFCVGAILHAVALVELTASAGHIPVDNFYECSSLCALIVAILFLFVYWRHQFAGLSVFIFPLVFVMTEIGAMETPVATWPNQSIRQVWLLLHVVMILLGFAALLLTAVAAVFYLIQERHLKSKRPAKFFDRLPPLATLDDLVTNAMGLGFVFITLGTIAGSAWAFIESGTHWIADPRIGISLFTWLLYLVMVFLRNAAGWRGRKAAVLSLSVLGCAAVTWAAHVGLRSLLTK